MITEAEALQVARTSFPNGPETLVELLKPVVQVRPLDGCDGFCITRGDDAVIFLNEAHSLKKRRFTLAHELGHLLLGIPSVAGESLADMLSSDSADEKRVNAFAAELLLPATFVEATVSAIPVDAAVLRRLASKANVSEVTAALRVADLATEIGLMNAIVAHFVRDEMNWQWSRTHSTTTGSAFQLLRRARESAPKVFRADQEDGTAVVASIIENDFFETATLFVQVLPSHLAHNPTKDERRKELESLLLAEDSSLRHQVAGIFGAHNERIKGMNLQQALDSFWERYQQRLSGTSMDSAEGHEYVCLRIEQLLG